MIVVLVGAQVLRQRLDALGEESDLYFGGPGVAIVRGVVVHDRALRVSGERHVFLHFSFHYSGASYQTDPPAARGGPGFRRDRAPGVPSRRPAASGRPARPRWGNAAHRAVGSRAR